MDQLGSLFGHLETISAPSWPILGPSGGHLGPSWGRLGAILGHLEASRERKRREHANSAKFARCLGESTIFEVPVGHSESLLERLCNHLGFNMTHACPACPTSARNAPECPEMHPKWTFFPMFFGCGGVGHHREGEGHHPAGRGKTPGKIDPFVKKQ